MKPGSIPSVVSSGPTRASKLEKCTDGMKSLEKKARIVWRMKSVDVTRVMPSR